MHRFRLTSMQESMLYESLNSQSRYISTLRYKLDTPADAETLNQRLNLLIQRHEALRMRFVRGKNGEFWQEVGERDEGHFRINSTCPDELSVKFNHAMLDGWSVSVLMRELLSQEEPSDKPSPFRYYVKLLERRDETESLHWWHDYITDAPTKLPNNQSGGGYRRCELRFTLPDSALLRKRSQDLGVTAGRLLQAVWGILLARYNGGISVVPSVISGRSAPVPGITGMVGMCVNTVPVVTKLPTTPDSIQFDDWLAAWSRQAAETERRGFCRLDDLIKGPLPHLLAIDPSFDGAGYRLVSASADLVTDFDAAFTLANEIKAEFAYNACAYSLETVTNIRNHFLTALTAVLKNPQINMEQIPILTDTELHDLTVFEDDEEILNTINHNTVIDLWRESAAANADGIALVCGNVRLTYAELMDHACRMSAALRERGVRAETPVAVKLNRSERYVISELAVMEAGGFFIPLDPEWPEHRIKTILKETSPKLVIDEIFFDELTAAGHGIGLFPLPKPGDTAFMIMTSGTTGIPKGVMITHRNFSNFCLWARKRYGWKPGDADALVLGFGFDGSMWDIWLPLISGGTIHVLHDDVRFDIRALGKYCENERVTHIDLPVTLADSFREVYSDENRLPDLRVMVTGGEEVRRVVPAPYALSNEYGPTECTVCCSVGWAQDGETPASIGTPPPNMRVYLLDEWGRLCPDGVAGEAYFSGPQVARGYYNSPELTARSFIPNPFANSDANHRIMYRTGDLLKWRWRRGKRELIFVGRVDNQVKIRGFRVELGEIESALLAHPSVKAAVAAVRGDTDKRIHAYVTLSERIDISELKAFLTDRLPAFMLPIIIVTPNIPLNSSGKVDFGRLPLPEPTDTVYSEPITEAERTLVALVSELLSACNIGTAHNYIELGGNSINAMRLTLRLERMGWRLTAPEILASHNLAALAAKMRPCETVDMETSSSPTFVPLDVQKSMVFLSETEGAGMYTITLRLSANGLSADELRVRLDRAAALHDILRTRFTRNSDGSVLGIVHDYHSVTLSTGDPRPSGGIDPLHDPLLDLTLRNGELIIRYHHIAFDGFSISLLTDELIHGTFPKAAPSFAVFANRLNKRAEFRADDEAWWRTYCSGAEAVQLLPHKTASAPEYKHLLFCSPELLSRCATAAKAIRVTLAAFVLSAWSEVLHAMGGGSNDILVPFVSSCRDDDCLMGMCAAVCLLRFGHTNGDSEHIGHGFENIGSSFDHTDRTFGDMARLVQDASQECAIHVFMPPELTSWEYLFVFDDAAGSSSASGEQSYDLVVHFAGKGEIFYNASRCDDEFISFIASKLEAALYAALRNEVSLFSDGEYERVTETFSCGKILDVKYKTAAESFLSATARYPDCAALETDTVTLTYAELSRRSQSLAGVLSSQGIGKGDIVAFCLPRTAEGIIAAIGIMLSGAAFLPLDPSWPQLRIDDILRDSGAAAVIYDDLHTQSADAGTFIQNGLTFRITGIRADIPDDSAYIIYTSGTTGTPKGVVIPHLALANQIVWTLDEFGFAPDDKMLHYMSFSFDPSVWVTFGTLSSGGTLSLLPEHLRLDPEAAALWMRERRITLCTLPAAIGADILRFTSGGYLRTAFIGGEAPKYLPLRATPKYNWEAVNLYGPTEYCINATFRRMPPGETETNNIGIPVANTRCYVLDAYGKPCPVGIAGELCVGGAQLAYGYLNRSAETSAAFVTHPQFGRIYRTGDRVMWINDGTLKFLGREDGQVKIRGHRVELSEIENALRRIDGVVDAKLKLTDGALDAYVVTANDVSADILKERLPLPSYMMPRTITTLNAFPLTSNGKVNVSALPLPDSGSTAGKPPVTKTEKTVAAAWKTALASESAIARSDNFFDLGGHSLLLFQVLGLLATSGVRVDIKTLITYPILAELADAIDCLKHDAPPISFVDTCENHRTYSLYVQEMSDVALSKKRPFDNILIIGGTGFLGSHLVYEFFKTTDATIHLAIRSSIERIADTLMYYFGSAGTEIAASERLKIYYTDISEETPDICAPLDAIFHAAADIRHYAPESEMYKANVTATENMLKLASRHPGVLFAHISTTSAVNLPVIRENDNTLGSVFDNIYQRTKQLAEQRVLEAGARGLRYAIFRIGHISPSLSTGAFARNSEINATLRLLRAMFLTGLLPEKDDAIGFGFADETARAIRLLSEPENLENKTFHIDNPQKIKLSKLFDLTGVHGKLLPRDKLASALQEITLDSGADEHVRQAASEYLGRISQGDLEKSTSDITGGKVKMDATLTLLKRLGFEWPQATERYLRAFRDFNFKS